MDLSNLTLVALIGAIAAFWSQVRSIANSIASLFVGNIKVEWTLGEAVGFSVLNRHRILLKGGMTFRSKEFYLKNKSRVAEVPLESCSSSGMLVLVGLAPVVVREEKGGSRVPLTILYLRGTFSPQKFISRCVDTMDEVRRKNVISDRYKAERRYGSRGSSKKSRFGLGGEFGFGGDEGEAPTASILASKPVGYEWKDLISRRRNSNEIPFSKAHLDVLDDVHTWIKSETWYKERMITWRRGYLFHGKPGSGKTSAAKMIAKKFDLPIYSFDLASFTNEELYTQWTNCARCSPCIILLEDIDNVFKGRENIVNVMGEMGVTFDNLINLIDGAQEMDGVIVIITTNDFKSLDPALIREGRTDEHYEFGPLSMPEAMMICSKFLPEIDEVERTKMAKQACADKLMANQMVKLCKGRAISIYWESGNGKKD